MYVTRILLLITNFLKTNSCRQRDAKEKIEHLLSDHAAAITSGLWDLC